ncbi:thiolase C-terminal domain-containing protein [Planomonospora venezuelensis]|uniref:Acetyl-CoA acetyltransferase n=1 Tax=Planomonospora venezuelensis TaxID=1999 RepID=A0A841DBG8_PLAVE|nr:acetyl-CoA acetyltransferase [Planomonospora venezuelensis]MBB5965638.1 acetyl-CoA acetyltransferase [Planomonospora venezuelensis]GIN02481.1 lipid-transfer protein [Planomonospora venezuelensis]
MRDRAAVAGIGMTALTRSSGRTELELAVEASRAACADAGVEPGEVDAVLSYHLNDSAPVVQVAAALRIEPLGWHNDITGGGTQAASILGDAAMLVASGLARTVLVYRALNGRSGTRMNTVSTGPQERFTRPYGMAGPIPMFALAAQRYLHETGLTEEHLHAVVAQSRENAAANPRALRRDPLSLEDYLARPYVCSPLRTVDCCQETDGACALVVRDARLAPGAPRIHAVVRGGGPGCSSMDRSPDVTQIFSGHLAPLLWERSGMKPGDVDVALLYDAYSWLVPRQLEDFGLAARAELGEFLLRRRHAAVNPHGGLLSEGYVHGLNNVAQAVRELRGDRETALVTGFGGSYGSAAILTRGR